MTFVIHLYTDSIKWRWIDDRSNGAKSIDFTDGWDDISPGAVSRSFMFWEITMQSFLETSALCIASWSSAIHVTNYLALVTHQRNSKAEHCFRPVRPCVCVRAINEKSLIRNMRNLVEIFYGALEVIEFVGDV